MGLRNRTQYLHENCFFVTTTCYRWYHLLESAESKVIVTDSINFLNEKYKTAVLSYVIMPNHLHLILHFNENNELSNWMRDLKKFTAVKIRKHIEHTGNLKLLEQLRLPRRKQVFKVWEDRFDDVVLNTSKLLLIKLNYIHNNPMQEHWNLVSKPEDWRYSSAAFYELGEETPVIVTDYREYF